jgi:hypothetical protein
MMSNIKRLCDVAKLIRSKNAGPFLITFDVIFNNVEDYKKFVKGKYLTREKISELYNVKVDEIREFTEYENGNAVKFTLRRPVSSGDIGDTDVYGAQQHAPLLFIEVADW